MIELAGTKSLSRLGAYTFRMNETQGINKSPSCWIDDFTAIGDISSHVTYLIIFI